MSTDIMIDGSAETLAALQSKYNGAMSRQGWPRGKYHHRIGSVRTVYSADACDGIFLAFDIADRADVMRFVLGDSGYCDIVVYGAIGIESYSKMSAFLSGFNFANSR